MRVVALSLLLVACKSPQPANVVAAPPSEDATPAVSAEPPPPVVVDASPPDTAPKPVCPTSFRATHTTACILTQPVTRCEYAEAECYCGPPPQCGGAYMPHPLGSPGQWHCTPKIAGVVRADGCPLAPPPKGAACATAGKTCEYGPCSWSRTTATCKGGAWNVTQYMGPPPP